MKLRIKKLWTTPKKPIWGGPIIIPIVIEKRLDKNPAFFLIKNKLPGNFHDF
jgi:hypothetical protein